jgi:hypothetical protein
MFIVGIASGLCGRLDKINYYGTDTPVGWQAEWFTVEVPAFICPNDSHIPRDVMTAVARDSGGITLVASVVPPMPVSITPTSTR